LYLQMAKVPSMASKDVLLIHGALLLLPMQYCSNMNAN
jgi:hypothetical protein